MSWRPMKLDCVKAPVRYAFVGGPFGSNLTTRDYVEEGVPVIRGNNLPAESSFHDDDFVFVSEKKADDLRANTAYPGDVVFTQRGTLGQVGLVPLESRFPRYIISQSQMKLTVHPEVGDPRFIYYFFRMPATVQKVVNHALTSGVPHINLGILKDFQISLPLVGVQQRVADILSAYDDLIENNRRRMALLEEAARQLYREWFVRLRFPGHEHTPITDGVPEGWEKKQLGELCSLRAGDTFKLRYQGQRNGDLPFAKVRDLSRANNEISIIGADNWVSVDECEDFRGRPFPMGTIVFAKIGEGLRKNRVRLIVRDTLIDNNMMGAVPITGVGETPYLYLVLASYDFGGNAIGAAVPFLSAKVLSEERFLFPSHSIRRQFNELVGSILEQITSLQRQNAESTRARDLLLPRLMSGEIAV